MDPSIVGIGHRITELLVRKGGMPLDTLEATIGISFNLFYLALDQAVADGRLRLTRKDGAYWVSSEFDGSPHSSGIKRRKGKGGLLRILIIGKNCPICRALFNLVLRAVDVLRVGASVDIHRPIGKREACSPPCHVLVINGEVRTIEGDLPEEDEVRSWLEETNGCGGA